MEKKTNICEYYTVTKIWSYSTLLRCTPLVEAGYRIFGAKLSDIDHILFKEKNIIFNYQKARFFRNQPYGQMSNPYQQRGPSLYAPPGPPVMHQNGPPGVVPTSNPYYQPPVPPQHHHMQPQAPMMSPGMHGQQQQQPYYNTQSPLTGLFEILSKKKNTILNYF